MILYLLVMIELMIQPLRYAKLLLIVFDGTKFDKPVYWKKTSANFI